MKLYHAVADFFLTKTKTTIFDINYELFIGLKRNLVTATYIVRVILI